MSPTRTMANMLEAAARDPQPVANLGDQLAGALRDNGACRIEIGGYLTAMLNEFGARFPEARETLEYHIAANREKGRAAA